MKVKKLLAVFIAAMLLLSSVLYSAGATVVPLEDFSYEISSAGITVTAYNGTDTDVIIADSYEINGISYEVSSIGEYAFENSSATSIELPEGLSAIGEGAFYNCDSLTAVIIPDSVTEIGLYAFDDCNSLTDVTVMNPTVTIGDSAFGYYYSGRKYYVVENFVLKGISGSTAEEYAEANGMTFEVYVKPVLGDVTGDNILNVKDMVRLKKILAGSILASGSYPDINGDGASSAEDLVCIRILLLFGEENLEKHTVTFKDSNGNILDQQKVLHSFAATAPEAPAVEGYVFVGWSESYTSIMKDTVITALYEQDTVPRFVVESVTAAAGESGVTVAVSVKNNPGILGMTLSVEFDESALTLTNASNGEALSGVLNFTKANVLKSGCNFVWDGQELTDGSIKDGTVLLLEFDVLSTAASGIYPISISYDNGGIIGGELESLSLKIESGNIIIP